MDFTSLLANFISDEKWIAFINGAIKITIILLIGLLVYWIAKKWLYKLVFKLTRKTSTNWDDLMFTKKFFHQIGRAHV